ncbi:MAG: restriction endonuclease [Bacteroides sp.]|nr:restriction endonuclease [Bacteroides sp.]
MIAAERAFISGLKSGLFELKDYVDFDKVVEHTEKVKIYLNALNELLSSSDVSLTVHALWADNPKIFSVLGILLAVRDSEGKFVLLPNGSNVHMSDYFNSPESVVEYLSKTGLLSFFHNQKVNNLIDYVFGIEVGLDTHARKNRGGELMQKYISDILSSKNVTFQCQVPVKKLPNELKKSFGKKRKVFDFVFKGNDKTWIVEVNFYGSTGSKISETTSSYINLQELITRVPGYDFMWITDGGAWKKDSASLSNAIENINHFYNLKSFEEEIDKILEE